LQDNLKTVRSEAPEVLSSQATSARVQMRIDEILHAIESEPKPVAWKLRDRIGRRKIWYQLPDEVEQ
jgi:hypothetical protein